MAQQEDAKFGAGIDPVKDHHAKKQYSQNDQRDEIKSPFHGVEGTKDGDNIDKSDDRADELKRTKASK